MEYQSLLSSLKQFLKERFDLTQEKADENETVEAIKRGVVFKGTNLWVLIFAILIASLGLNVNSTAVIIGAMLISPLMGPIMGVGLGLGINDLELIKKSARNLAIASIIGLGTAALYFLITPLNEARSELLARTSPTIYDVLIALFGGLAGIVAGSSKERGNVIPGVAIATALMPPLCTAGFGIATGNVQYFLGAFYLYFINSVFISLATYIGVRIFKFQHKTFMDPQRGKTVKRYVTTIVILTIIPSIWVSYKTIRESYLQSRINNFIRSEIVTDNRQVISKEIDLNGRQPKIALVMIGKSVTPDEQATLFNKLERYGLSGSLLTITNGSEGTTDISSLKKMVLEDFYAKSEAELKNKQAQIEQLTTRINDFERLDSKSIQLTKEIKVLFPEISKIALARGIERNTTNTQSDTIVFAMIGKDKPIQNVTKLQDWLKTRIGVEKIKVVFE